MSTACAGNRESNPSILTPGGTGPQSSVMRRWADRLWGATVCALWVEVPLPGKTPLFMFIKEVVVNLFSANKNNFEFLMWIS